MTEQKESTAKKKAIQTMSGVVVSNKMEQTIVVSIERKVPHPRYKKYIRKRTKVFAQDASNECREGDMVLIESCRPLSKNKCWMLVKILETNNISES